MFGKLCGAKARTNGHKPCRQPAMANGKCRLHGGKCTGPTTAQGKERVKQANTIHGRYFAEAIAERKRIREIWREAKLLLASL